MTPELALTTAPLPVVLVVDDDRRVRELLEVALSTHGFRVACAADGDEAVRKALSERPDLIVLDVRLPKRSGLEVCEALRADSESASVPIILVSAAAETDARLQAFARGVDDYLAKPFSPKELIARIKRLLSRTAEFRQARRRAQELEHELARAQAEMRRAHLESAREQRLREIALGLGRDVYRLEDPDAIAQHLLIAVQARAGVQSAALLARQRAGGPLVATAVRGAGYERLAAIELDADGPLATLLAGLGRPAHHAELGRLAELRVELAPLVAAGFSTVTPIRGADGLEGVLLVDERVDGTSLTGADLESIAAIAEVAAVGLVNGRRASEHCDRLLDLAFRGELEADAARAETATLLARAASALPLHPRARRLLDHAATLGPGALAHDGRSELARLRGMDGTGCIASLVGIVERAWDPTVIHAGGDPEDERVARLLRIGSAYAEARRSGLAVADAVERAVQSDPFDPPTAEAFRAAALTAD